MKLYESFNKFLKEADIMGDSRVEDMCYAYSARTGQTYKVEGNEAIFPDGTVFKFVLNADGDIEYYIIDKNGKATRSALINDRGLIDKFTGIIEAEDNPAFKDKYKVLINGKEVKPGDKIKSFRGEEYVFKGVTNPGTPFGGMNGKIVVARGDGEREYYPSVFDAKLEKINEAEDKKVDEVGTTKYTIRYWIDEEARDEGFSETYTIEASSLEEAIAKTKEFYYDQECASCELEPYDDESVAYFGCYPDEMVNFSAGETVTLEEIDESANIRHSKEYLNSQKEFICDDCGLEFDRDEITAEDEEGNDLCPACASSNIISNSDELDESEDEMVRLWVNGRFFWEGKKSEVDENLILDVAQQASDEFGRDFDADEVDIKPVELDESEITPYLDKELEDDETETGGTSHAGETVREFIDSVDTTINTLEELNKALKDCGIKPIITEEDKDDAIWHIIDKYEAGGMSRDRVIEEVTKLNNGDEAEIEADLALIFKESEKLNEADLSVDKIAKFLEDSVNTLQTTEYTCCRYILDDELAIFVGWTDGFDEEDPDYIHAPESPSWVIAAGIKERADALWTDYDYLNFPVIPNGDAKGMVADNEITMSPNENYKQDAEFFVDAYKEVKEALDKGELVYSRDYEG